VILEAHERNIILKREGTKILESLLPEVTQIILKETCSQILSTAKAFSFSFSFFYLFVC